MDKITELLPLLHQEFSKNEVPHFQRPMLAMSEISKRLKISIMFDSKEANFIQDWFSTRSKPEAMKTGSIYQAAFYFDSEFWPVQVPMIFGSVSVSAFDAISEMPVSVKEKIQNDNHNIWHYSLFWADCFDLSYGFFDIEKNNDLDQKGLQFLKAAFEELKSATALLLEPRINKRAILNLRMALEIFLKSYLAIKKGLSDKEARAIGHDLKTALTEFSTLSKIDLSEDDINSLDLFPKISKRYEEQDISSKDISICYNFSLFIGATICRELSGRNMRAHVLGNNL